MKKLFALALVVVALGACTSSALEREATAANLANVQALAEESARYTAADPLLPSVAKDLRAARNREAVELARNLAGAVR